MKTTKKLSVFFTLLVISVSGYSQVLSGNEIYNNTPATGQELYWSSAGIVGTQNIVSALSAGAGISITGTTTATITATNNGTVTSFSSGNLSPLLTTSVATATTTPVLSFTLSSQSANTVFASPNGSSGTPTFRSLVNADFPTSGVTAGTYPSVTVNAQGIVTSASSNASLSIQDVTATTGGSTQATANVLALAPAATIATYTVTLPASPTNGFIFSLNTTKTITTITLAAGTGGASIQNTFTSITANSYTQWIYDASQNQWLNL
jgi:hypothetical protein